MPLTSKDAILGVDDIQPPTEFHVPEWNDTVYLRHPTANDRDAWEIYCRENKDKTGVQWRAHLAAVLLCDDKGKRLFTTAEEIRRLGDHSAAAIHRIWEKGLEMMAITDVEVTQLEKN